MKNYKIPDNRKAKTEYSRQGEWDEQNGSGNFRSQAAQIVKIAREQDLPVLQSPDLVESLLKQDVETVLQEELKQTVFEIFSLLHTLKG